MPNVKLGEEVSEFVDAPPKAFFPALVVSMPNLMKRRSVKQPPALTNSRKDK